VLPQPAHPAPEHPGEEDEPYDDGDDEDDREDDMVGDEPELERERPRHREEKVEVDERPGGYEEQLVDDLAADQAGEGRARDDRREHHEHHERAEVCREHVVARNRDRVRRDDR